MTGARQCESHADLVAELATATERARSLERERDEHTAALIAVERRIRQLEVRLALYAGVAACAGALLPYVVKLALPEAAAAFGG